MAVSLIKLDDFEGSLQSPASNRPFAIQDPNSVWIVEYGKLDLFLTAARNGEVSGPRYPVMRVEEGHAIFGVGFDFDGEVMLMASAAPGTRLRWQPQSRLREAVASKRDDEAALHSLEDWIRALSIGLSGNTGPRDFLTLAAGETTISGESTALVPEAEVLWVAHRKGNSRFLGNDQIPLVEGAHFFPVSRHAWLEATPRSVLYAIDSRALQQHDPEWLGRSSATCCGRTAIGGGALHGSPVRGFPGGWK